MLTFSEQQQNKQKTYLILDDGQIQGKLINARKVLPTTFTPNILNTENIMAQIVASAEEGIPEQITCLDGVIRNIKVEAFETLPQKLVNRPLGTVQYKYLRADENQYGKSMLVPFMLIVSNGIYKYITWEAEYITEDAQIEAEAKLEVKPPRTVSRINGKKVLVEGGVHDTVEIPVEEIKAAQEALLEEKKQKELAA